jgi:hypothetical protein
MALSLPLQIGNVSVSAMLVPPLMLRKTTVERIKLRGFTQAMGNSRGVRSEPGSGSDRVIGARLSRSNMSGSDHFALRAQCKRGRLRSSRDPGPYTTEMFYLPSLTVGLLTHPIYAAAFLWQVVHFFEVGAVVSAFTFATAS